MSIADSDRFSYWLAGDKIRVKKEARKKTLAWDYRAMKYSVFSPTLPLFKMLYLTKKQKRCNRVFQ